jgi:hypothetical protein
MRILNGLRPGAALAGMVALAAVTTMTACGGATEDATASASASAGSGAAAAAASTDSGMAYPAAYKALSLPELEDATLTSTGRQTTSLRDGLALTLTTARTVDQARAYYHEALTTLGWIEEKPGPAGRTPNMPVRNVTFNKDAVTFTATMTAVSANETRVDLRVLER